MRRLFAGLITSLLVCVMVLTGVHAETLSASKTLTSPTYGTTTVIKMTATASCPNTGTFSWTVNQKESYKQGPGYSAFTTKKEWTKDTTNKKAIFDWGYSVYQLPTGSGSSTLYAKGTGKATFTYNTTTKKLSVQ